MLRRVSDRRRLLGHDFFRNSRRKAVAIWFDLNCAFIQYCVRRSSKLCHAVVLDHCHSSRFKDALPIGRVATRICQRFFNDSDSEHGKPVNAHHIPMKPGLRLIRRPSRVDLVDQLIQTRRANDRKGMCAVTSREQIEMPLSMAGSEQRESWDSAASAVWNDSTDQLSQLAPLLDDLSRTYSQPSRTVVVMPAYNAEATLKKTVDDIPANSVDEIILVDDCSADSTVDAARELGLTVVRHEQNGGYGANQKTCYSHALERGADYIVMVHPDFQYDSRVVDVAVKILKLDICDVVMGSRIRTRKETLGGGMPLYKYIGNRILTTVENTLLGQNLGDFHSGFRAYRRSVLEAIPYHRNSDDFVFDSEFLAQAVHFGFRIGDIPVPVRYFPEASSIDFRRSMRYGLSTLGVLARFWGHRLGIRPSEFLEADQTHRR